MNRSAGMVINILVKEEDDLFVAHCMELDIVATGHSLEEATRDLEDLIIAQLRYAFANDNLAHLYRPAPPEIWEQFYKCGEAPREKKISVPVDESAEGAFMPPWIIAQFCGPEMKRHV
jgi:predicted RNase H-like HicB family nuclease